MVTFLGKLLFFWANEEFRGIWQSVQRPNLSDNGPIKVINLPPKIITFPQKCDHIPSISDHFPRNHFDPPKYVHLRAFYWLSRVAFTHFLSRNPPVCQECGVGVKPILAMPGFWQLLTLQPLPNNGKKLTANNNNNNGKKLPANNNNGQKTQLTASRCSSVVSLCVRTGAWATWKQKSEREQPGGKNSGDEKNVSKIGFYP